MIALGLDEQAVHDADAKSRLDHGQAVSYTHLIRASASRRSTRAASSSARGIVLPFISAPQRAEANLALIHI